jgi:hypothetical protein
VFRHSFLENNCSTVLSFHNSAGHGSAQAKKEGEVEGHADSAPTAATAATIGADETIPVAARHGETLQVCYVGLPHLFEGGGGCGPVLCM